MQYINNRTKTASARDTSRAAPCRMYSILLRCRRIGLRVNFCTPLTENRPAGPALVAEGGGGGGGGSSFGGKGSFSERIGRVAHGTSSASDSQSPPYPVWEHLQAPGGALRLVQEGQRDRGALHCRAQRGIRGGPGTQRSSIHAKTAEACDRMRWPQHFVVFRGAQRCWEDGRTGFAALSVA